jgi:hypothetical protein
VVTVDADFIGSNETAQKLQRSLGQPWKLREATLDDFGHQVAKVQPRLARGCHIPRCAAVQVSMRCR